MKTLETTQHSMMWNAILQLAPQLPDIHSVTAARFGKQVAVLPPMSEYDTSLVVVWLQDHPENTHYLWLNSATSLNIKHSYGELCHQMRWFQMLCSANYSVTQPNEHDSDVDMRDETESRETPTTDVQVGQSLETIDEHSDENEDDESPLIVRNTTDVLVEHGNIALRYPLMNMELTNKKVFTGCSLEGWDPTLQMPQSAEGFAGNHDASEVRIPNEYDVQRDDNLTYKDVCRPDFLLVSPETPTASIHIPEPRYHVRCANLRSEPATTTHIQDTNDSADLQ